MDNAPNQPRMPLSLLALIGAGSVFMLAGFLLMHVAAPPTSAPRLFEGLMMIGALFDVVFAFRWWTWLKSIRSP